MAPETEFNAVESKVGELASMRPGQDGPGNPGPAGTRSPNFAWLQ